MLKYDKEIHGSIRSQFADEVGITPKLDLVESFILDFIRAQYDIPEEQRKIIVKRCEQYLTFQRTKSDVFQVLTRAVVEYETRNKKYNGKIFNMLQKDYILKYAFMNFLMAMVTTHIIEQ